MNIEFKCPFCDNEMSVDSARKGHRGKCPRCNHIITVPEQSESEMEFFDGNNFFEDGHLNKLFAQFLEDNEDEIISQQINRKESSMYLHIRTPGGRSQLVKFGIWTDEDDEKYLAALSVIGEVTNSDDFFKLLGLSVGASAFPTFALRLNEGSKTFFLNCAYRLKDIDHKAFHDMTIKLARRADAFEREVLGVDEY